MAVKNPRFAQFLWTCLPFLFRGCPNYNAHWIWDYDCDCCAGNYFAWHNTYKYWYPNHGSSKFGNNTSSISYSGMATTWDFIGPAIKLGLAVGLCLLALVYLFLSVVKTNAQISRDNQQTNFERAAN